MAFFKKAFEKLAKGLAKTRDKFLGGLKSMLMGRVLDDELLMEIEEKLIQADIGVAAATKMTSDLQQAYKEKRIQRGEDVLEFLKQELKILAAGRPKRAFRAERADGDSGGRD